MFHFIGSYVLFYRVSCSSVIRSNVLFFYVFFVRSVVLVVVSDVLFYRF